MQSPREPYFLATLLVFLLLVSAAHGAEFADAADAAATATDGDDRTTVRTGAAGHAGHGYSSHSGAHPNGNTPEQGGAGVVHPLNLAGRSHRRNGAASRVNRYSSLMICAFLEVLLAVVLI